MPVTTRQIGPCFAAEVGGIDLTRPLSSADVKAVHAGMDEYAVLVFHDQKLADEQRLAFSRSLGELEHAVGTSLRAPDEYRLPTTFADVSNLDKDNNVFARDDRRRLFAIGNRLWHSDSSFKVVPAKYDPARARDPLEGRQHGVRRHARGLRRARRRDQGRDRGLDLRALADLLAPAARLLRLHRGGACALQAGAPAPGAHSSVDRPEVALPRVARVPHHRLAGAGGARLPA